MIQNKFVDGGYKLITGGAPSWRWLWWVFLMQESTCFSTTTKQDNRQYIWMHLDIFDDFRCTWGHQGALNVLVNLNESHRRASQHWFPFDKSLFFPQLWVTHGHTFQTTHFLRSTQRLSPDRYQPMAMGDASSNHPWSRGVPDFPGAFPSLESATLHHPGAHEVCGTAGYVAWAWVFGSGMRLKGGCVESKMRLLVDWMNI